MNEREQGILVGYIRDVADRLRLSEWTFTLSPTPPDRDDSYACVLGTEGRRHATIRVCADFRSLSPDAQRNTIVHELMHCHHDAATDVIRLTLPKLLPQHTYEAVWEPFRQQFEYMTDLLAAAFDRHMPYIDWGDTLPATEAEIRVADPEPD